MKKNLLTMAALAASFFFLQPDAMAQSISVGPRLGLNVSTVAFTDGDSDYIRILNDDKASVTGIHAGAVVNIGVNDMFSIQPEILFSQKGLKFEESGDSYATQMNYLEIPVLAKLGFGSGDVRFFVNAGPYLAYMMSGQNKIEINGEERSSDIDFDYPDKNPLYPEYNRDKPNRLDYGLAAGAGIGLKAGPGTFNMEARYGFGLNDITTYEKGRSNEVPRGTNSTLGFSVSYLFPLN